MTNNEILDVYKFPNKEYFQQTEQTENGEVIIWGISGAAARAIALFQMVNTSIELGEKPNVIIGQSSGSLVAPIAAVAYQCPQLMKDAIKFAESLDTRDMFPYKGNVPLTKRGNPTPMGILRAITHNHLGFQDIKPMYKKVFKEEHFQLLKQSPIKCISFGVKGKNWTPVMYCLNDAESLDDMIDMIECSARIVPFTQPMNYKGDTHVDGGFISFNPAMWLFDKYNIKQLVTFYANPVKSGITENKKWDKSILSITFQAMNAMPSWLAYKDAIIEELYCKLHNIPYLRIEAPDGYTDEIYETDDHQLIALGLASKEKAENLWTNFKSILS